jgi:peptide/nickel transport system permease protein
MSFLRFLFKRGIQTILVVLAVITLTFLLRMFTPGNVIDLIAPASVDEATRQAIVERLGLNEPMYVQYVEYLSSLLEGDLGYSYKSNIAVDQLVIGRLPATLELAVAATLISVVIAIPLGVISAKRRNDLPDLLATSGSLVGISTPNFWLGTMMILILSVNLGLFPSSTRPVGFWESLVMLSGGNVDGLVTWTSHITMPAITLGTYYTALLTRLTRSGMLEELGKPYVTALEAKGLPKTLVNFKHAFKNTLIPIVTILGLQIGGLIGGSVIVESIFAWPGLGTTLIGAINVRDWPLVQGCILVITIAYVFMNFVVDALYVRLDPRVSYND